MRSSNRANLQSLLRRVVINRKRSILPWISAFLSASSRRVLYLRKYRASPARVRRSILSRIASIPASPCCNVIFRWTLPSSSSGNVQRRSSLNCRWKLILMWLAMLLLDVKHLWVRKRLYIQCEIESRSRWCTSLVNFIQLRILSYDEIDLIHAFYLKYRKWHFSPS